MRIAIVGSGVAGLVCAHVLSDIHDVVVYEKDTRPGGHAHTQRVALDDGDVDVDTGFLVHNLANYPGLRRLFDELGVATQPSEMSFSVHDEETDICWRGTSPATVFAQRANLARPEFLRMLGDVVWFNRRCRQLLARDEAADPALTLRDLVDRHGWSARLVDWYLVPLGSAVWSAEPRTFLDMPALTFARFFDNHGLLRMGGGKGWRTVTGGSQRYVTAIGARLGARLRLGAPVRSISRGPTAVEVTTTTGPPESFDHVILATHSDQALSVLSDPSPAEREVLGSIRFRANAATLHTDEQMLPPNRRAWASWNYHRARPDGDGDGGATVTYLLNRLQSLPTRHNVCVTLNRDEEIRPERVLARMRYDHPIFDRPAVAAQARHHEISGVERTSYCGAYWGFGFHEDGLQSAVRVCEALGAPHRLGAT